MNKLAQNSIDLYDKTKGNLKGFGPLGLEQGQNGISVFATFISSAIGLMTLIGIIWFVFLFFTGAIGIITSGGDKQALEGAKKKLTSGVIGLVVILFAVLIIGFIGSILGFGTLLNIKELFELIQIN